MIIISVAIRQQYMYVCMYVCTFTWGYVYLYEDALSWLGTEMLSVSVTS